MSTNESAAAALAERIVLTQQSDDSEEREWALDMLFSRMARLGYTLTPDGEMAPLGN